MKKIYLLLVLCCLNFSVFATHWYSVVVNGSVNVPANWNSSITGMGTTGSGTPAVFFSNPMDTFELTVLMRIFPGEHWQVEGTVICGLGTLRKQSTGDDTISIGKALILDGKGVKIVANSPAQGYFGIHLYGDLEVKDSSYIYKQFISIDPSPQYVPDNITVRFCDTSASYSAPKTIKWSTKVDTMANTNRTTALVFDRRCVRKLISDVPVPVFARGGVKLYGTLICDTFKMYSHVTDTFMIDSGAHLYTAHANGIDHSIQDMKLRDFSNEAHYYYNGKVAQTTGATLPNNFAEPGSVTIMNNAGVQLSQSTIFAAGSMVNLDYGMFDHTNQLTMASNSLVNVDSGDFVSAPMYNPGVHVTYKDIGLDGDLLIESGWALRPLLAAGVGNLTIDKPLPGASVTLNSHVTINGNILLKAGLLDAGGFVPGGPFDITAKGNWTNDAGMGAYSYSFGGKVKLTGTAPQVIGGAFPTTFGLVEVDNNGGGVTIDTTTYIEEQLTFHNGTIDINADTLFMGYNASPITAMPPGFDNSRMIIADSTGVVARVFSGDSYFFPIGDAANYTPVNVGIADGFAMGGASWMGVNTHTGKHPDNANVTDHIKRYWRVYMNEIFFPIYTVTANYADADIEGDETKISMGKYTGSLPWTKYGPAVTGSNTLTAGGVEEDETEFTGISTALPSIVAPADVRICDAATATLTATAPNGDPGLTYTWSPTTNLSATNALTTVVSSTVTGVTTYTITITDGNGFEGYATTTVTIDPTPRLVELTAKDVNGTPNAACLNADLFLKAVPSTPINTYLWEGPVAISTGGTTANETVNTVTPSASGVYTLTISNGTEPGCTAVHMTPSVTVNPLPGAPTIATENDLLSEFCVSTVFTVTAVPGIVVTYQGNTSGGTVFAPMLSETVTVTATDIYYYRSIDPSTACWGGEVSKAVTINPLPVAYQVTIGGVPSDGSYCENGTGLSVGLDGSELGVKYVLLRDGTTTEDTLDGTGAALDFGLYTEEGAYTVFAKNVNTGCELPYAGTALTITIVDLPTQYPMNGNGYYCEGSGGAHNVILLGSDPGVEYQLYHRDTTAGALPVAVGGAIPGTTLEIDFGPYSAVGTYSVIATNFISGLGCTIAMDSTDSIYVHPLPNIYAMMGVNDTICEGFGAVSNVNLKFNGPDTWATYYLFENGIEQTNFPGDNLALLDFGSWPSVGTAPGTYIYTIEARDSACKVMMTGGDTVVVAPAPFRYNVSGGGSYCAGMPDSFSIYIDNSDFGIKYEVTDMFLNPLMAAVDGIGGFLQVGRTSDPLTYYVFATNTVTGCTAQMTGEAKIESNGLPTTEGLLGGGHYCDGVAPGVNISMTGYTPDPNIRYYLYHETDGLVTSISETSDFGMYMTGGRYYATIMNVATGCAGVVSDTVEIVIDPLPVVQTVSGGGVYCANDVSSHPIRLDNSEGTEIDYTLTKDGTDVIGVFDGTGTVLAFGSTIVTGTYTVSAKNEITGCESNMSGSASIISQPIPVAFEVNGGGRYCEGSGGPLVTLTGSETDINYQLYRNGMAWGAPLSGTTTGLNFGVQDSNGVYTIIGTNTATSCQNPMDSFAFVTVKPIPVVFDVAGAGPYCDGDTGQHVYLSASYVGTEYQLLRDGSPEGAPMAGTGFGLDFGLFTTPGSYTVVGKLLSDSCTLNMRYTVVLSINPKPTVFAVGGGGTICADSVGVPVTLSGSQDSVRYQVYNGTTPVGTPVDGTGRAITFGMYNVAGTYKVVATSLITACVDTMSGDATVVVNPLPTPFAVTGGGDFCEGDGGLSLGLANSETGVIYQLYSGGLPVAAPQIGTGSVVNFGLIPTGGTYIVKAVGPTGCASTMSGSANIIVNPLPDVFFVSGGGSYCEGGSGVLVLLSGSKPGVEYQLFAGSSATGIPRPGTGSVINFGYQRPDSTYTVMATNTVTNCTKKMDGNAVVTIIPYTAPTVTLTASPSTLIAVGEKATVVATVTGAGIGTPTFAWRINRNPVPGEYSNTLNFTMYYDNDTIECDVMSHGVCGGIVTTKQIIFHLKPVGVQEIASLNGVIRLVPNPNKGAFSLKGSLGIAADEELHAEVTNMLGQVVYSSKITARNGEVDEQIQLGGNLANGMYLLNLRGNNARGVFHFVVEQ